MLPLADLLGPFPDETVASRPVTLRAPSGRGSGISVVVPTLNEVDSLPACLDAVQPQLRNGDEVIVVDGGSTDGTVALAQQAGAEVIVAQGSSIGAARDVGTRAATNEIVASTDADAIPPSDWLSTIRSHFASDPDLVCLWGNIVDRNGVPIRSLVGRFSTITGGASGNNTAFRATAYDRLDDAYPDISFMEDVVIINRLARLGKTRRDTNMVMVMDMDRSRYQTIPLLAASGALFGGSLLVNSPLLAKAMQGVGIGVAGTELTYESATETPLHHDQVGAGVAAFGALSGTSVAPYVAGAGFGMIAHHDATEGISAFPSGREKHTDEVVASAPARAAVSRLRSRLRETF